MQILGFKSLFFFFASVRYHGHILSGKTSYELAGGSILSTLLNGAEDDCREYKLAGLLGFIVS